MVLHRPIELAGILVTWPEEHESMAVRPLPLLGSEQPNDPIVFNFRAWGVATQLGELVSGIPCPNLPELQKEGAARIGQPSVN